MEKPQLILVPGVMNDSEIWQEVVLDLSADFSIAIPDIAKCEAIDDIRDAILSLAEDRFALIGFSLGGIAALHLMRSAAARVTHLGLLNTTMSPDSPERAEERKVLASQAYSGTRFHGFGQGLIASYLAPENQKRLELIKTARDMMLRLGPDVLRRQMATVRPDNRDVLSRLTCPTLVLCGEHDVVTPPALHRQMVEAIDGAELVIVPGAGHLTPMERPDVVSEAIRRLLDRC